MTVIGLQELQKGDSVLPMPSIYGGGVIPKISKKGKEKKKH